MTRVARPGSLPAADDRFVVVEASAGTGKTYFLEHRVVDLIVRGGAELGQILLVTFTDKAVAELRLRIRDLLDRLSRATEDCPEEVDHWDLDDDARAKLRAAVTAFDHAPIFTIHGFCHRVLIEDAFAARRLFDQTQIADQVAFDNAFASLLRERFARVSPDRDLLGAFLETDRSIDRLRELLLRCARADALPRQGLDAASIDQALETFRRQFGTAAARAGVLALLASTRHWLAPRLDLVAEALDRCPPGSPTPRQLACLDEVRETALMIAERGGKLVPQVLEAVRAVATAISLDEAIAGELLPPILERIGLDKAEHGQFDYDDMLELVRDALAHPSRGPELAARLRTRTPWAMIDEFQDTDLVQWQIFRQVWMHPDARGLTIVGDPKQAIYGFRGADVATYLAARDELLRTGATRIPLTVNRRSTERLVGAVNGILVGTPFNVMLDKTITYDEPVSASGDITGDHFHAPVTVFALTGKGTVDANRTALAGAIGAEIESLRERPPSWEVRGVPRPFALGDVMVLTRSNRDSVTIAASLRARGLPCALVEPERLFATREAAELAAVLSAVAAPRDRSARLRALRTRFFDVPWAQLIGMVDAPDHHPTIARLFDWAQLGARRMYESLFRRLVEDSRFAERALVLGGGERAVTNTWHLIELLLDEVARARCDLYELVVQLRRWIDDDTAHTDERDVQRADSDADAIRILTIHKAKGLEAPFVFLFGGSSAAPKSSVQTLRIDGARALFVGQTDPAIQQKLEDEADAENQRLAYVALTRAQLRLYLPLYGEKGLAERAAYAPIQRCITPWVTSRKDAAFARVDVEVGADDEPEPPRDALDGLGVPASPVVAALAALPPRRTGLAMVSYTRLAHQLDAQLAASMPPTATIDPAEFDVDDTAGEVGPDDLPPGADSGLMLHAILEDADLDLVRRERDLAAWYAEPAVRALVEDAAREHGIDRTYHAHAAQMVHATLTRPLALTDGATLPALIDATALAREVEFTYPIAERDPEAPSRGLVRGYIDALVAYGDDLWVLDYKSDFLGSGTPAELAVAAAERVERDYLIQVRLYALAADRIRCGRRLAGLLYQFIRHDLVVAIRIQPDSIAKWTRWLEEIPA